MIFLSLFNLSTFNNSYGDIIKNTNRQILFKYLYDNETVTKSPLNVCLQIIKETFLYLGQNIINLEYFNLILYQIISPEIEKNEAVISFQNLQNCLI